MATMTQQSRCQSFIERFIVARAPYITDEAQGDAAVAEGARLFDKIYLTSLEIDEETA